MKRLSKVLKVRLKKRCEQIGRNTQKSMTSYFVNVYSYIKHKYNLTKLHGVYFWVLLFTIQSSQELFMIYSYSEIGSLYHLLASNFLTSVSISLSFMNLLGRSKIADIMLAHYFKQTFGA